MLKGIRVYKGFNEIKKLRKGLDYEKMVEDLEGA